MAWITAAAVVFLFAFAWTRVMAVGPPASLLGVASVSLVAGGLLGEGLWRRKSD